MRNKIKTLAAALAMFTIVANAQQVIQIEPFTQIVIRNTTNVSLKQSATNSIILPDSSDNSKLKYQIKNNTLIIDGRVQLLTVMAQQITSIDVEGTGSLTVSDTLHTTNLELSISGTGRVGALVIADNIKASISGAGNVALSGTANDIVIDISGSGRVNAEFLKVKNATANISGSGKATIDVTDNLTANISGTGSVYYKTKPSSINKTLSGIGSVRELSTDNSDTTHVQIGDMNIDIFNNKKDSVKFFSQPRKANGWWGGIDIGFNGWLSSNGTDTPNGYDFLELIPEKSIAINFNFAEFNYGLIKSKKHVLVATTGVGLSYNNYRFRKNISLIPDTSMLWYTKDTINYKKNKLTVSYLTVPALLTFNSHQFAKKAFHVTAGFLLSYKIGTHTKRVYEIDSEKKKDKTFDDFNINPFRTDATLRIGYREVTVFANYALTEFLKSGRGPVLHPWTFGVSLTGW